MINNQYETFLKHVYENGTSKGDRTGTGTKSVFGYQMRFNLQEGFPLVTTKKLHIRSIIHELLWFLNGDTNINYLNKNKVTIWDEWADENGDLGPVYGSQWRYMPCQSIGNMKFKEYDIHKSKHTLCRPDYDFRSLIDGAYSPDSYKALLAKYYIHTKRDEALLHIWIKMIQACINTKCNMCAIWTSFQCFRVTVTTIPMYAYWLKSPNSYELNPYYWGDGVYGPDTCVFTPKQLHIGPGNAYTKCDGCDYINEEHYKDVNQTERFPENFEIVRFPTGKVVRPQLFIDQISDLIDGIKNNPNSRRHIVCAWNPTEIENQALPPCHAMFQFYVNDGKLSCALYQRSCDSFLGVPFNIASYALLTYMVAQQCGLDVGEFVWTGGDCHIYNNHFEQTELQLSREPRDYPKLVIKRKPNSIFDYQFDDFEIIDYDPHPVIKAPIAV